ncbi:hypothetical protein J2W29_004310 [Variovorax boronicumulans]|nr:hypothetical protein [Variovorax boronicumulans]
MLSVTVTCNGPAVAFAKFRNGNVYSSRCAKILRE